MKKIDSATDLLLAMLRFTLLLWLSAGVGIAYAENAGRPTAVISGLGMKLGDSGHWSQVNFDSTSWPTSTFGSAGFNRVLIPETIGWLRTQPFGLPAVFRQQPIAVHVISGASFQIYWNGRLLGQNGQPGIDLASETNGISDSRYYIAPSEIWPQGNVLAVRYSAHGYQRMHLPLAFSFKVSRFENEKYERLQNYVPAFLLIGGVGAAAIFFVALYVRRRADIGSMWLALMFLMVVVQSASETSRALTSFTYIGQVSRIGATFLAAYGSGLFLNLYLLDYLGVRKLKRPALLAAHVGAAFALAAYYQNFDVLTFALLAIFVGSALGITAYGVYNRKRYGLPILLVLAGFVSCFLVGPTLFLDRYYFGAMALLASTLFVVQAAIFRETQRQFSETLVTVNRLELDLLKRQIQPHFIMNTLTALSEWIVTSPDQGVDMIEALGEEFRLLNDFVGKKLVPLESEISLCRAHLKLMSYRQDLNFILESHIDNKGLLIPPAVLHTLIENALTHNRYATPSPAFQLTQRLLDEQTIELTLTAPSGERVHKTSNSVEVGGLGLTYVRARLEESWGSNVSFTDGECEDGRWKSVIVMPKTNTVDGAG